jgi:hypothetical protein
MIKDYKSIDDVVEDLGLENNIITTDFDAWELLPDYRHVYNKLELALAQDLEAGPMGIYPENYPIIMKPIINLYGMSRGFKIINSKEEYDKNISDGSFWMPYFKGEQINVDLIILDGKIKFYATLYSKDNGDGTFEYHQYLPDYKLGKKAKKWIKENLEGYNGCLNLEIIDDNIIEAHLRLNGDFYLYNDDFVKEVNSLYTNRTFRKKNFIKSKSLFIFPIFVPNKIDMFKDVNFNKILDAAKKFKVNSFRIDNINSEHQKEGLSRLFMYDIDDYNLGKRLKKYIFKNINIK